MSSRWSSTGACVLSLLAAACTSDPGHARDALPEGVLLQMMEPVDTYGVGPSTVVASGGDVNGDGFGDLLLGDPAHALQAHTTTIAGVGQATLHLGSTDSRAWRTAVWTVTGQIENAHVGAALATCDIDADGYSDVLVGVPGLSRVDVYLGGENGPSWAQSLHGTTGDQFGAAVACAGDVDGDGHGEVLVGAPTTTDTQVGEGEARLFAWDAGALTTTPVWTFQANQSAAKVGLAVATAGDVNGDGYSDVLVATPWWDSGGKADRGIAWAFYGSANGLSPTASWYHQGAAAGDGFGAAVTSVGDRDGDGDSEVLIGAPGLDVASGSLRTDAGGAYLFLGASTGLSTTPDDVSTVVDPKSNGHDGASVAGGDFDGDGYGDYAVGAPGEYLVGSTILHGMVTVCATHRGCEHYWNPAGYDVTWGESLAATDLYGDGRADLVSTANRAYVLHDTGRTGHNDAAVAEPSGTLPNGRAGDVDGDGYDDVVVVDDAGLSFYRGGPAVADGVYGVVFSTSPTWTVANTATVTFAGPATLLGDIDGDGLADLAVRAIQDTDPRTAVLYGTTADTPRAMDLLASGLVGGGDVDGDGRTDALFDAGSAHSQEMVGLLYGSATGLVEAPVPWRVVDTDSWYGVSTAGDFDGDGYADVVVAAPGAAGQAGSHAGKVRTYLGGPAGPSRTAPDWEIEGTRAGEYLGGTFQGTPTVWPAGDVNGDGYGDLLVLEDFPGTGTDRQAFASLYVGSASGLEATASWRVQLPVTDGYFEESAAPGDIDGDGYADLAFSVGRSGENQFIVYHGGSAGPEGPYTDEGLWWADTYGLAGAGDFNGDGRSDLLTRSGYLWVGALEGGQGNISSMPRRAEGFRAQQITSTPLGRWGRSASTDRFAVTGRGTSWFGRGRVAIEVEAKPIGQSFDSTGRVRGPWLVAGDAAATLQTQIASLVPGTAYHWRARVVLDPTQGSPVLEGPWTWGGRGDEVHVATSCVSDPDEDRICDPNDNDADNDGWPDDQDCGPLDPAIYPGAPDQPNDGIDQDCNGYDAVLCFVDGDLDGWGGVYDHIDVRGWCELGWSDQSGDCADGDGSRNPGAQEVCDPNNTDEDCDGSADDQDTSVSDATRSTFWADTDGDGLGDPQVTSRRCHAVAGWVDNADDCDDGDPAVTVATDWYPDCDGDGVPGDAPLASCGMPAAGSDGCGAGVDPLGGWTQVVPATWDCADDDAARSPDHTEVCDPNNVDEDCNQLADDDDAGATGMQTWYTDGDGDGFGTGASFDACDPPAGSVTQAGDCDDAREDVNPGGTEVCDPDNVDEDCDGKADDLDPDGAEGTQTWYADLDGDGHGDPNTSFDLCDPTSDMVTTADDCSDTNADAWQATDWYPDCDGDAATSSTATPSCGEPPLAANTCGALTFPAGGWYAAPTVPADCDDLDARRTPGKTETCDPDDVDEDCDGLADDLDPEGATGGTTYYQDRDGDGHSGATSDTFCDPKQGWDTSITDCDDDDPTAWTVTRWWADCDGDGTNGSETLDTCGVPNADEIASGQICGDTAPLGDFHAEPTALDCDDGDAARSPNLPEICDDADVDEDCDGQADDKDPDGASGGSTFYWDDDGDGHAGGTTTSVRCDPTAHWLPVADDCDDTDLSAWEITTWYADCDGDGVRGDRTVDTCGVPTADEVAVADPCGGVAPLGDFGPAPSPVDCDDLDPNRSPILSEKCDDANVDEDCDGLADDLDPEGASGKVAVYYDGDGDGYGVGEAADATFVCDPTDHQAIWRNDCDDTRADVNPGETEVCDPDDVDEDCNGRADDADGAATGRSTYYHDGDGDGHGGTTTGSFCDPSAQWTAVSGDCDDQDGSAWQVTTWYADCDGDGVAGTATLDTCGTPSYSEVSDAKPCGDTAPVGAWGSAPAVADCDDHDAARSPDKAEVCDPANVDEDCDGLADDADPEGAGGTTAWYADGDDDGFGAGDPVMQCDAPTGAVAASGDCDDLRADVNPDGTEVCDADNADEDCDGQADDADPEGAAGTTPFFFDEDGDGHAGPTEGDYCDPPAHWYAATDDCDDADGSAWQVSTWYADCDGDGVAGTATLDTCGVPDAAEVTAGEPCGASTPLGAWGSAPAVADCDDHDAARSPDKAEVCDPANVDEDCDGLADDADPEGAGGTTAWYADGDDDGFGAGDPVMQCDAPTGAVAASGDCDDLRADVNPDGTEVCDADNADEDCDGEADDADPEGAAGMTSWYTDADADGFGTGDPVAACDAPAGTSAVDGDCDDGQAGINPAAQEVCDPNDVDEDCDGLADDDDPSAIGQLTVYRDGDGDGFGDTATSEAFCDPPQGWVGDDTDCDDTRVQVHPGAIEQCDDRDDDCNNVKDDGVQDLTWYADADEDGYGDDADTVVDCAQPEGYVLESGDCDDAVAATNPDATEVCDNGVDDDCDDLVDTDDVEDCPTDTGGADTGFDTGSVDTGSQDTGSVDTGSRDTGSVDTGSRDTGTPPAPKGCGCDHRPVPGLPVAPVLLLAGLLVRRRRSPVS